MDTLQVSVVNWIFMKEKLQNLKYFLKGRKLVGLLALLIIVAAVPVAVYLTQKVTRFQAPAADEFVDINFSPSSQTLPPNSVFRIMLSARTNNVSFARVVFSFDRTKVRLASEITTTPLLPDIIQKSTMAEANATGLATIVLAVPPSQTLPTGVIEFASFNLTKVSVIPNDRTSLLFLRSDTQDMQNMQIVTDESLTPTINITDASLTLNPAATPTPTPLPTITPAFTSTPTPIPTNTPTPTRIPTSTPIPTASPTQAPTPTIGSGCPTGQENPHWVFDEEYQLCYVDYTCGFSDLRCNF